MTGVRFTESMKGFYGNRAPGYDTGEQIGLRDDLRLEFTLTISTRDLGKVIGDPNHTMTATGFIRCTALTPEPITVTDGTFDLFAAGVAPARRTMRYRLPFEIDGRKMTLLGSKDVGNDWGVDMWSDTTTLYIRLMDGHVGWDPDIDRAPERARGILTLTAGMLLRQLSSFRGLGTPRFGLFFARQLWKVYVGTRKRHPLTNASKAERTPVVHQ